LAALSSSGSASRPWPESATVWGAQQVRTRALELVERSRLRHGQQLQRRVQRAGLALALRRGQRTLGPVRRLGRKLGGAFVEGGGRR
jgi:hypothetical protein